jgi:WD40 repeat protein
MIKNNKFIIALYLGLIEILYSPSVVCADEPAPIIFEGHTDSVECIVYSPDGTTLASGSWDETIILRDAKTGTPKRTITDLPDVVRDIAYSPDRKTLASASDDGTINLWNAKTGELQHTLLDHSDTVRALAYSPDGKTLASASDDSTIKLWDTKTGTLKHSLLDHSDTVRALAYSPDGKTLASASDDNTIKLWDAKTGGLKNTLTEHSSFVIAYSPDGKLLVSASYDKTVKLWDTETNVIKHTLKHTGDVNALAYSPTENILATVSEDMINLWDTNTGELIVNWQYSSSLNAIAFSVDGQTLASASGDDIQIWSASRRQKRRITQLSDLPDNIQEFEEKVSDQLEQVKTTLEGVDSALRRELPEELTRWLENIRRLEKAGELTALRNLEIPDDKALLKKVSLRQTRGVEILELKQVINNTGLSKLEKLRVSLANMPVLDRSESLEKFQVLKTEILSQLSKLDNHLTVIENLKPAGDSVLAKGESEDEEQQGAILPLTDKTKLLPHNGLFRRRDNAFGTELTIGFKELIKQGVLIEPRNIRFDDFVAQNTENIPSPQANNALEVSYGIAEIPAYRDSRATHYLEIVLKTADKAPSRQAETNKVPLPLNYIFVIDTSDSMNDGNKLDTVKSAIGELFGHLKKDDILGIIKFNHQVETVLEATPVSRINSDDFDFGKKINGITASGGTDLNMGLSYGIDEISRHGNRQTVNQIFLFSDGNPTSGVTDWIKIQQNIAAKIRDNDIRISTFAFGSNASRQINKLAIGGKSIFFTKKEDVHKGLQQDFNKRTHLAAINVQMQIEIDPEIDILHFYGHELITDPDTRAAIETEADLVRENVEEDYDIKSQPHLITEDKGIRFFVPNLAVGETYWAVFELAIPEPSDLGKATVQYFDTFARQNKTHQFYLSPKSQIDSRLVAQHGLGLWTSEVVYDAFADLYSNDLETAEKRIRYHILRLEAAKKEVASKKLVVDDIITLRNFLSLIQNWGKPIYVQDELQGDANWVSGLDVIIRAMNGYVRNDNE